MCGMHLYDDIIADKRLLYLCVSVFKREKKLSLLHKAIHRIWT